MSKNRYDGIESYAVAFASYKAKILIRTPHFSYDDYIDLQQELIMAYLHAVPKFDATKGDRRSFIKTVINNAAKNIIISAEQPSRWTGLTNISLFNDIDGEIGIVDELPIIEDPDVLLKISIEQSLKNMPDDLMDLLEHLKTTGIIEISKKTGIPKQTLVSRLKRLRIYLRENGM